MFAAYEHALARPADRQLRKRARLYAELEIARWLLHGIDSRDEGIIADAEGMLDALRTTVQNDLLNPLSTDTGQIMAVEDVEAMLDRTPLPGRSATSVGAESKAHANRIAED